MHCPNQVSWSARFGFHAGLFGVLLWLGAAGCGSDSPSDPGGGAALSAAPSAIAGRVGSGSGAAASGGSAAAASGGAGLAGGSSAAGRASAAAAGSGAASVAGGGGPIGGSAGAATAAGSAGGPLAGSGAAGDTLAATIEMRAVAPGGEDHVCIVAELANSAPVWVSELHATLTDGSHHLIVDRRAANSALQTQPVACSPTMGGDDTRLMIAQQHDSRISLPKGVAYRLEPHQRIFLQLHYINLKAAPADIRGVIELRLADPNAGTPKEAQSIFSGSLSITIDPHAAGSSQFFQRPAATSAKRIHVFALTSHTHSLGVRATIERVSSIDAAATTPIHLSENWAEPPLTFFSPGLDFTGSDGLRLICHYMNNTDRTVHFGTEFNEEMCFMWMYFYFD